MSEEQKIAVYSIWCEATELSGIQTHDLQTVKDIIEGDMEILTDEELKDAVYKITIEFMTEDEYNNLPEYEY